MTTLIVDLKPIANQQVNVSIEQQPFVINVYQGGDTYLYTDILIAETPIILGSRIVRNNPIVYATLGTLDGNFYWRLLDDNTDTFSYIELGSTIFLYYSDEVIE